MLAAAFLIECRPASITAGQEAARLLAPRQWTKRFNAQVEAETVLIPARLHFTSSQLALPENDQAWRFTRALQTRSNDGFERQRAARDLLTELEPWAAPFIVALIGEYIVEILEDISNALTPDLEQTLAAFIADNEALWSTTKRRITSYWNAYYRLGVNLRPTYRRAEYVGFELADRLDAAVIERAQSASE